MRALILHGPGRLSLEEVPRPRAGAGEIVLRVHSATICGTDVRILDGTKTRDVRPGHPIGHECAGTIAEIGPEVRGFREGEAVSVCVVVSCGRCAACAMDRENLCVNRSTLGYHTDGCFAEYMRIPAAAVERGNLFRLPDAVPLEVAPLLEPTGCCINGWHELAVGQDEAGRRGRESLVIFGAGPIGLIHLMLARAGGVTPQRVGFVTVVEPLPHRREAARRFGADEAVDFEGFDVRDRFDSAILAVGRTELVEVAMRAVRDCGRISLFAGFDRGASVAIDPNAIHYRQLRLTGGSESRRRDYRQALDMAAAGRLNLAPLITHRYPIERYQEAFDAAANRRGLKVALTL